MSFGITTRNANQLLYRPGLDSNFWEGYTEYPPEWNRILKVGTTTVPELSMTRIAGPARLYPSGEGEPPVLETISVGDKVSAVDREYQSGYGVTRLAREDDLYGKLNNGAKYLGNASRMTLEYNAAAFLNDLFSGSVFLGMDGLSILNASHTLLRSSSTVSNMAATPVGFSIAGVTALMDLAAHAKNENGDPIQVRLDTAIIPNDEGMAQDAMRIFGQDLEPFTANHNDNAVKGRLGKVNWFQSHFMTSTSNYFMIDSKLNDAHFLQRIPLAIWDWKDDPTGTTFVAARMRFMTYAFNWRGWYGANPT